MVHDTITTGGGCHLCSMTVVHEGNEKTNMLPRPKVCITQVWKGMRVEGNWLVIKADSTENEMPSPYSVSMRRRGLDGTAKHSTLVQSIVYGSGFSPHEVTQDVVLPDCCLDLQVWHHSV